MLVLLQALDAFERWLAMDEPDWAKVHFPRIDYQDSYYYAAPSEKKGPKSLDEVDPEILAVYEKVGYPVEGTGGSGRRRRCAEVRRGCDL